MSKRRLSRHRIGLAALLLLGGCASRAVAAGIQWTTPTTISADSDVLSTGSLNYAYDLSNSGSTVNGVAFIGASSFTALGSDVTFGGSPGFYKDNPTAFVMSTGSPATNLTPQYQTVLTGAIFSSGTGAATATLNNLTAGHQYAAQVWVDDSRFLATAARTETVNGGGNTVTLTFPANATGALGRYTTGYFTADSANQTFTLSSSAANNVVQLNALQVRDVTNIGFWSGTGGGSWDASVTPNFCTSYYANPFAAGTFNQAEGLVSTVSFGDYYYNSGGTVAVTQNHVSIAAGGVQASTLFFVNHALNYTLTSSDSEGISGPSAVVVLGGGLVTFAGANSYTGGTTITSGTLQIGNGGGAGSLPASTAIADNGGLIFNRNDNYGGAVNNMLGGSGSIALAGGVLALGGTNSFSGGTLITGGSLQVARAQALGTGGLTLGGGTLDMNSFSLAVPFLAGSGGAITDNGAGGGATTLTVVQSANTAFAGSLSDGATATLAFVKSGTGSLTFAAANGYSGATTISAGTLVVNGPLASGSISIAASAALAGSGNMAGNVTLASGGLVNLSGGTIGGLLAAAGGQWNGTGTVAGAASLNGGLFSVGGGANLIAPGGLAVNGGTMAGSGTVSGNTTLANNAAIGLSGGTLAGTLDVSGGSWLGTGTVTAAITSGAGQFAIGGGASLAAPGGLFVTGGALANSGTLAGSLNYTSSTSSAFFGAVTGPGGVTLNNSAATLTLGGADSYTGQTALSAGTLIVNGTHAGGGAYTIAVGAELSGNGTVSGTNTVTLNAGGLIAPGPSPVAGAVGTLTLPNFTTGGFGALDFDLSATTAAGDLIKVTSSLSLTGTTSLSVNVVNGFALPAGQYPIFTYGTLSSHTSASLSLANTGFLTPRQSYKFDYATPGTVYLDMIGGPANLTWVGPSGASWDNAGGTANWNSGLSPDRFYSDDNVNFSASHSGTVAVNAAVVPGTVTVTGSYTFSGSGQIAGGALTLQSPTLLTVANTGNSYAGGTNIQGGTLALGANNALPVAGAVILGGSGSGGTFNLAGFNQVLGNLAVAPGAAPSAQVVTAAGGSSTLTVNNTSGSIAVFSGTIEDNAKTTGGTLGLTVGGGTLDVSGGSAIYSGATSVAGGAALVAASLPNASGISVAAGGTLVVTGSGIGLPPLVNSGSASFTAVGGTVSLGSLSGAGTTSFAAAASLPAANTGTINFNAAASSIASLGNATINLNGTNLTVSAGTQTTGSIGGSGTLSMTGPGTLVLAASNSYSGGTMLTGGLLSFAASAIPAAGSITPDGGTLQWNAGNTQDISGHLAMLNSTTAVLNTNGNNVTLASAFGSGSTAALEKTGGGYLILSKLNNFSGGLIVAGGIVQDAATVSTSASGGALGVTNTTTAAITVFSGGQVDINGASAHNFPYGLTIAGTGPNGQGALVNNGVSGGTNSQSSPNIALSGDAAIGGNGGIYMTAANHGPDTLNLNGHTLTKLGGNTLFLDNTTVTAGTISIVQGSIGLNAASTGSFAGAAAFVLANSAGAQILLPSTTGCNLTIGSLSGGGPAGGNVVLGAGTLTVAGTGASTYAGAVSGGSAGVLAVAAGRLTLTGTSTYPGATALNGGTLQVSSNLSLGAGSAALAFNGGTLRITGAGEVDTNRATTLGPSGGIFDIEVGSSGGAVFAANISGSGALTKTGSALMELDGLDTYQGGTFVTDGTLLVTTPASLPDGSSLTVGSASAFAPVVPTSPAVTAPVSEPSTPLLLLAAAAGLLLRSARRSWLRRSQRGRRALSNARRGKRLKIAN